ncbi:MAG: tyrosine-type recombinase/integrase [Candidatus Electronema sp. V4]|uniref:tyrosine-type recombinase/integrase n=1 Tax=Candidatus Electronema sp. V4 TaxID=3454756 RepID=UPI0040558D9B
MPYWNKQRKKWMAQVLHEGQKHRSQHESKTAAKQWEAEKKKELESSGGGPQEPAVIRTLSLHDWATMYLDHAKMKFSVKTYKEKHFVFRQLFTAFDPDTQVFRLHKGQVLAHFRDQAGSRSGYAANKDRKNLIAAWNWGIQYLPGFPKENPFLTERFAEERSPRHVPSEKDFWAVYEAAESDQDRLMLLCYLHLAARRNEIFHLRREDVDLDRRRVRLATRKRKDGSQQYDWLPLTDRLHNALSEHLAATSGPWVFLDPRSGLPYVYRQKWLDRLCRKAETEPFGLHGIRHLSASILIKAKVSLLDVQAILRHTNLTTTQRYVHRLESVRKAIEVFE